MAKFNSGFLPQESLDVVSSFEQDAAQMAAQIEAELGALSLDSVISA